METKVAQLIKSVTNAELQIELSRIQLNEVKGFDAQAAFNAIDSNHTGAIDASSLKAFLDNNDQNTLLEEAAAIIKQYDHSGKNILFAEDFENAIIPKSNPFIKQSTFSQGKDELIWNIANFLSKETDLIRSTNPLKLELNETKEFNIYDAFKSIDTTNKGTFNYQELDEFMQKQGVFLSNSEILALFRRASKNSSNKITIAEFKKTIFSEAIPGKLYENQKLQEQQASQLQSSPETIRNSAKAQNLDDIATPPRDYTQKVDNNTKFETPNKKQDSIDNEIKYKPLYSTGPSYLPETYKYQDNYPGKYDHLGSDNTSYYSKYYIPSYSSYYDSIAYENYLNSRSSYYREKALEAKYDYLYSSYPRLYSDYSFYPYSSYSAYLDAKLEAQRLDNKIELARINSKYDYLSSKYDYLYSLDYKYSRLYNRSYYYDYLYSKYDYLYSKYDYLYTRPYYVASSYYPYYSRYLSSYYYTYPYSYSTYSSLYYPTRYSYYYPYTYSYRSYLNSLDDYYYSYRSYYLPYYYKNYSAYDYLYYSPYYSRYTPIRSSYYYDYLYDKYSLSSYYYRPYYSYYYRSYYSPYYSSSYYRYLRNSYYSDLATLSTYRRRYYDDEYISYYSYSKYLQDKYEVEKSIKEKNNASNEKKKQYFDDNLFGYDTPQGKTNNNLSNSHSNISASQSKPYLIKSAAGIEELKNKYLLLAGDLENSSKKY